jgi:hypothetical protein
MPDARRGNGWTAEDDAVIRKMVAENKSALLIAAKLKRSIGSVRRRGAEIGAFVQSTRETKRRARAHLPPGILSHELRDER